MVCPFVFMRTMSDDSDANMGRAAKRLRLSETNDKSVDSEIALPPEIWADILEFASFEAILSMGATCRTMLHDTMKLVTTLQIDKSSQLNAAVASRFRDVREIHINSLLTLETINAGTEYEIDDIEVDYFTQSRALFFLTKFNNLERVIFGGKTIMGEDIEGFVPVDGSFGSSDEPFPQDGANEMMVAFIGSISQAFRCKALPKNLKISGLCCPDARNHSDDSQRSHCFVCEMACTHFPLESVVEFESRCSSREKAKAKKRYGLDTCLRRTDIEEMIEQRPGGSELLRSHARVLLLLGQGIPDKLVTDSGNVLHIVEFSEKLLEELGRVIKYAELDVKKLSPQDVAESIMKSFTCSKGRMPSKNLCYFAHTSFQQLKDNVGLPVEESSFYHSAKEMTDFLPLVLKSVMETAEKEDIKIRLKYITLLRYILECEVNCIVIQQVLDSGVVQLLVSRYSSKNRADIIAIFSTMVEQGTRHQHEVMAGLDTASLFAKRLRSNPRGNDVKLCIKALNCLILSSGMKKMMASADVKTLIDHMSSSDISLSELVLESLGHIQKNYQDSHRLLLENGIMQQLLHKVQKLEKDETLRLTTKMMLECCRAMSKVVRPEIDLNSCLETFARLLLRNDEEVLQNVCSAIQVLLRVVSFDSSARKGIKGHVESIVCYRLLHLLRCSDPMVQELSMEGIYLITLNGGSSEAVNCIIHGDGFSNISALVTQKKTTESINRHASESINRHACSTICNVVGCQSLKSLSHEKRIQAILDNNLGPWLAQMLTSASLATQKGALWTMYFATKEGGSEQIQRLVEHGWVDGLGNLLLSDDRQISTVVLMILKNVSKASNLDVGKANTCLTEDKVDELEMKISSMRHEKESIERLEKMLSINGEMDHLLMELEQDEASLCLLSDNEEENDADPQTEKELEEANTRIKMTRQDIVQQFGNLLQKEGAC